MTILIAVALVVICLFLIIPSISAKKPISETGVDHEINQIAEPRKEDASSKKDYPYVPNIDDFLTYDYVGSAENHTPSDVLAVESPQNSRYASYITDNVNLLTEYEKDSLSKELIELSEHCQMDIAIVTVNSVGSKSVQAFADDFYDENNFGFNDSKDGVLLLLVMESRDWYISTSGDAISAISDSQIEILADSFVAFLSDGEYYKGFEVFAEKAADMIIRSK